MCLSFPGAAIPVMRPYRIQVDYIAFPNGKHRKIWLQGHEAVGFQHECDHLQGITIFHRYKWQLQEKMSRMAAQVTPEPEFPAVPLIYDPTKD
jgi:peptide deformylase